MCSFTHKSLIHRCLNSICLVLTAFGCLNHCHIHFFQREHNVLMTFQLLKSFSFHFNSCVYWNASSGPLPYRAFQKLSEF